ncbi:hypothetical protein GOP47_0000983 [Adiantum capillus-veneris]|uniref:Glycosyltransferase 61 catalytic domain-containing protein n=1 Tax=Adiantum capillus-veneris TaxID=13818 RepID=A0A9D4VEX2_ADICA|nr:hypothetical protein GOP47_0000983 [Adiantum capillus-veneris]
MQVGALLSRFTSLLIFVGILLLALGVTLYQVNRVLQELVHTQKLQSSSWSQMQWLSRTQAGSSANYDIASALTHGEAADLPHQQKEIDIAREQVQGLLKEAITYREEMEELKGRLSGLEREFKKEAYKEETIREFQSKLIQLEREFKQKLTPSVQEPSLKFSPLKDQKMQEKGDSHVNHYFMSVLKGRGMEEGPPELFVFPNGANEPRLLCLRGNSTSDGAHNSYALAFKEEVPTGVQMVPGITLLSDTFWDFNNPWHSMFNLLQFVYWHIDNGCSHAKNLLLFHQGEYRTSMGSWIRSIFTASGVPSTPTSIDELASSVSHALGGIQAPIVCFEHAVVSRSGIGGMKRPLLSRMFREASCQARRACNIHVGKEGFTNQTRRVHVTLIVRKGARGFLDEAAWQRVVKEQCEVALHCTWSLMYVANLTFCQQVEAMSRTNILVSAHGAQLANIIFMPPEGRVLEMFPFGWLEMAGHGQYIYRNLANWVNLQHEGYWRDPSTPPCPNPSEASACFSHYKDQPLGINVTYIQNWLGDVIKRYQHPSMPSTFSEQSYEALNSSNPNICECNNA